MTFSHSLCLHNDSFALLKAEQYDKLLTQFTYLKTRLFLHQMRGKQISSCKFYVKSLTKIF
jgi:hypothetical protein